LGERVIAWPADLTSDVARRRCVVFLGAGISQNSQNSSGRSPKTWHAFLEGACQSISKAQHIKRLIRENDLLTACELVKKNLGTDTFNSLLIEEYLSPGYQPASIHDTIFNLDSRIVATPNFDKIYETYANHKANGSIRVKHQYDRDVAEAIRRSDRLVLKIHGTIDTPNQMVFTRAEYAEARSTYSEFYRVLEALALTHTFLFLGCGFNDPDIRLLLEDVFFRHRNARPHVFASPSGSVHRDVVDIIQATMNVTVLEYSPSGVHAELKRSLEELVKAVDLEREGVQKSMNW
jgi:SIR2-like domain